MKAHDILGVTIMADSAKIESAYSGKMNALLENGFDKTQPALYSRKAEELRKAREECLAYINAPFARKTQIEMTDCMNRMHSPNVTNSCCCGNSCESFCETACCVTVGAGVITLLGIITYKLQKAYENEKYRDLENRDTREVSRYEKLNNEIAETENEKNQKEQERERFQKELDSIHESANILNSFIEANVVSGNFMDSEACRGLEVKIDSLSKDIEAMEDEIKLDRAEANTIEQHHQEYLDYRNNRKR